MSIPVYPMGLLNGLGPYSKQVYVTNTEFSGKVTYDIGKTSNLPTTPIPNLTIDNNGLININVPPNYPFIEDKVYIFGQNPNENIYKTKYSVIQTAFNITKYDRPVLGNISSSNIISDDIQFITIPQIATNIGSMFANVGYTNTLPSLSISNVSIDTTNTNTSQISIKINKYTNYINQPVYIFAQNYDQAIYYNYRYYTNINFSLNVAPSPILIELSPQYILSDSNQIINITQSLPLSVMNTLRWSINKIATFTANNYISYNNNIIITSNGQNAEINIPVNTVISTQSIYIFVQNQVQYNIGPSSYTISNFILTSGASPVLINPGSQNINNYNSTETIIISQQSIYTGPLIWSMNITDDYNTSSSSLTISDYTFTISTDNSGQNGKILLPQTTLSMANKQIYIYVRNQAQAGLNLYTSMPSSYFTLYLNILYMFSTFTFTNLGATGSFGPTSISNYGTSYPGYGTQYALTLNNGIQTWIVPKTANYQIIAAGGAGTNGGNGIIVSNTVLLQAGSNISILVGQKGVTSAGTLNVAGGGGTYIVNKNNNTPILIAGGAGANTNGILTPIINGGSGGNAGGGAGLRDNSAIQESYGIAYSFINGGVGGYIQRHNGGFGGGGSGTSYAGLSIGGGGGYNGGNNNGGTSYDITSGNNAATLYTAYPGYSSGYNNGDGFVNITIV